MPEHSASDRRPDPPEKDDEDEQELSENLEAELGALEAVLSERPRTTQDAPNAEPSEEQSSPRDQSQHEDEDADTAA